MMIRPGQHISKLIVREVVSMGGFAIIVRVTTPDGREIALKIAKPDRAGDPFYAQKMANEVEVLRSLQDIEGVVRILPQSWERRPNEYLVVATELKWRPKFYAMEYLRGPSLEKHLKNVVRLAPAEAAAIGHKLALILNEVHKHGFAHNDIKANNILFRHRLVKGDQFVPVLIDFGIAVKYRKRALDSLTPTHSAPEVLDVALGEKPPETIEDSTRSDIWSLGVVLYQLIAGKLPFDGRTASGVRTSIRRHQMVALRKFQSDTPRYMEEVIMGKCLAEEVRYRPSAQELVETLAPFAQHQVQKVGRWS